MASRQSHQHPTNHRDTRITAKGDTFTVFLNGQKTVDGAHADKFVKGRIALQHRKGVSDETGVVKFRKVQMPL